MIAKSEEETRRIPEEKEKKKKEGMSIKEKKKARKRRNDAKMKNYAATIGVEDNDHYRRFKQKERLVINLSNTKYFIVKFVAKSLFNFKCSWKNQEPDQMDAGDWGDNK